MKKILLILLLINISVASFGQYYNIRIKPFVLSRTSTEISDIWNNELSNLPLYNQLTIFDKNNSEIINYKHIFTSTATEANTSVPVFSNLGKVELIGMSQYNSLCDPAFIKHAQDDNHPMPNFNYYILSLIFKCELNVSDNLYVTYAKSTEYSYNYKNEKVKIQGEITTTKFHFTFSKHIKKQENRDYLCQEDYVGIGYAFSIPVESTLWYSLDKNHWTVFKTISANSFGTKITYSEVASKGLINQRLYLKLTYTTEDGTYVEEFPRKDINNIKYNTDYYIEFKETTKVNDNDFSVNNNYLTLPTLTVNQTASIRDYFSENTPETISNNHKLLGGHSYEVYIKEDNKCPITKYVYLPEIEYKTINSSPYHFWYEDEVSNALNIIYNYPEILKDKTNPYSHSSDNRATFSNASRSLLGKITIKSPYNSSERITKNGIKETFSVVTNKNLTKITIEPKSSEFSDFIPINITDIKLEAYKKISWTIKPTITYPKTFCYNSEAILDFGSYEGGLQLDYCYQINDGSIIPIGKSISITNETPSFSLTIYDKETDGDIGREKRALKFTDFYTKNWPAEVKINNTTITDVKCFGDKTGKIEIVDYQLSRNDLSSTFKLMKNNQTVATFNTEFIDNLPSENYDLILSDSNGCKSEPLSITINQPNAPLEKSETIQHVTCFGYSDGYIEVNVSGGTKSYSYFWETEDGNDIENNSFKLENLKAGVYNLKIVDKNDCEISDSYTITQPDELKNSIPSKFELCDNEEYTIDVGEDEHFTNYEWVFPNNEKVEGRIFTINSQSLGGKYKLISKNANCFTENETDISFLHTKINNHKFTDLKCFEDKSGKIEITDFQMCKENLTPLFILTNLDSKDVLNQSNILFSNLKAGNYSLKLKDDYCYSDEVSIKISQPPLFQLNSDIKNVTCFDYSDGFVKAKVFGGTKPYFIEWNNGNEINKFNEKNEELYVFDNLKIGNYSFKAIDSKGCEKSDLYIITQPEKLENSIQSNFEICKNGELVIDQGANNNFDRYEWTFPNGEKFNERILNVNSQFSEGDYILTSYKGECFTKNITNIKFSENEIPIRFLVASENYLNDTLVVTEDTENSYLFDYFYEYDTENLKKIDINGEKNQFYLQAQNPGIYKITIHATDQNCITSKSKEITIINDQRDYFADNEYFTVGIFTNLKLGPSPNNGEFTLYVNLEKEAELEYSLTDLSRGVNVPLNINKPNYKSANYEIQFSGLNLKRGLYILMVKAENQTKKIKFVVEK